MEEIPSCMPMPKPMTTNQLVYQHLATIKEVVPLIWGSIRERPISAATFHIAYLLTVHSLLLLPSWWLSCLPFLWPLGVIGASGCLPAPLEGEEPSLVPARTCTHTHIKTTQHNKCLLMPAKSCSFMHKYSLRSKVHRRGKRV